MARDAPAVYGTGCAPQEVIPETSPQPAPTAAMRHRHGFKLSNSELGMLPGASSPVGARGTPNNGKSKPTKDLLLWGEGGRGKAGAYGQRSTSPPPLVEPSGADSRHSALNCACRPGGGRAMGRPPGGQIHDRCL